MIVAIGLGSNLGDRMAHLKAGVAFLETLLGPPVRVSCAYETSPVDCPEGSGLFLNAAVTGRYEGAPSELCRLLKEFELTRGPRPVPRNSPRALDLDLLAAGGISMQTAELTLPHPRMRQRRFVLEPLAEIDPDFRIGLEEKTVVQLLTELQSAENVRRHAALR